MSRILQYTGSCFQLEESGIMPIFREIDSDEPDWFDRWGAAVFTVWVVVILSAYSVWRGVSVLWSIFGNGTSTVIDYAGALLFAGIEFVAAGYAYGHAFGRRVPWRHTRDLASSRTNLSAFVLMVSLVVSETVALVVMMLDGDAIIFDEVRLIFILTGLSILLYVIYRKDLRRDQPDW